MLEAHNLTSLDGNSLENAIKNDFGLEITNAEKITTGYSSQVFKAKLQNQVVFVRINKDGTIFKVEQLGYQIFKEQGIPVPEIIAFKEKPQSIGYPTMVMSSAVGSNLDKMDMPQEQKDIIYERAGELLRKINETKLEGYGPLKIINQKLVGEFSSWKEFCDSQEEHNLMVLDFLLKKKFLANQEYDKIKKIYKEIALLDFGKASLLHRDMYRPHFFVKDNDISGVIDLGLLAAGDPRDDIAVSLSFQSPQQQEYFKKGYGDLANDPIVNKYFITMIVRKMYFRLQDETKGDVDILVPILKKALKKF